MATVHAVDALASTGLFAEADQAAKHVESPGQRGHALALLAHHHARAGAFEEALALASQAVDQISGTGAMGPVTEIVTSISGLLGRSGRSEEGRQLAGKVLETLTRIEDSSAAVNYLSRLAQAYSLCGGLAEAAGAIRRIPVPGWRSEALKRVSLVLVGNNNPEGVLGLVKDTELAEERADLLVSVAEARRNSGPELPAFAAQVLTAISEIPNRRRPYSRCVLRAAGVLISCGRTADLLEAVRAIEGKLDRADAWTGIIDRLAAAGLSKEAFELANEAVQLIESIDDYDERAKGFARLSMVFAHSNRLQDARRAAGKCHLPNEKLRALTEILRSWIAQERRPELAVALHAGPIEHGRAANSPT